ncbi:MAG: ATP-dependent transcriptional regulator, partial [Pseudomonadota bacterium]
ALAQIGRSAEANLVRMDSLAWARYGFGTQWAVRARLREISALSPANQTQ